MNRTFPVQAMELHLQDPSEDRLKLGTCINLSYTNQNKGHYQAIQQELENHRQTTTFLQSAIDNATQMMTGSKGGYKVSEYDENGRWLRDLYMNAPNKEDATLVMQINMNGIGFSRKGFDGPYKNAWTIDGVLLGEFIKAGSVTAEKLSAEYVAAVTDEIDTAVTAKFDVAEGLISAEVTRAINQEVELAAAINVQANQIALRVTEGEVEALIEENADSIRLKANQIAWESRYSSMSPEGILKCDSAELSGTFKCGSSHYIYVEDGKIKGGAKDLFTESQYGYIDYSAIVRNISTGMRHHGMNVNSDCIVLRAKELATIASTDESATAFVGGNGTLRIPTDLKADGDGGLSWTIQPIRFENGIMVTQI